MPVIPDGFGEVAWHWNLGDTAHKGVTTLGVALSGETSEAGLLAWHSAAMNNIMDLLVFEYWIEKVTLRVGGGLDTIEAAINHHGGDGGPGVSPAVCCLLKKTSGFGGRSHRGRMFLPGAPENQVNAAGVVDPGFRGFLTTAAQDLLVNVGNITGAVLLHATEAETPTNVSGINCEAQVATLKRRQRR